MNATSKTAKKRMLRDKFQYAAFSVHYRINRRAGLSNLDAFVQAIAATSDQRTDAVLQKYPDIIEKWQRLKKRTHYVEKDYKFHAGTNPYLWMHQPDSSGE